MTAQPDTPSPDTGSYEVIHLGGQAAAVVPVTNFLRLRALQKAATPEDLEDAEDTAAVLGGRPGTPPGRRRSCPPTKQGAGWASPGDPCGSTTTKRPPAQTRPPHPGHRSIPDSRVWLCCSPRDNDCDVALGRVIRWLIRDACLPADVRHMD